MISMEKDDFLTQLKTVFDMCDTQGLGYITVTSFLDLGHSYLGPNAKDIEGLLLLLDPGGKGYLNFEDFCRGIVASMQDCHPFGTGKQLRTRAYDEDDDDDDDDLYTNGDLEFEVRSDEVGCTCQDDDVMTVDSVTTTSVCALHPQRHHRDSPESFGDTDSAIVVVPPTSESGSGSPDFSRQPISVSDGEEKYECYGEGDCEDYEANPSAASTPTASNKNHQNRNGKSAPTFQKRTTWLRTSLRRSPSERRRLSSNALASQLYRSSSFNSSGRNSSSGESDDMHADLSLEEDVLDLNHKVLMLQQQVTAIADTQHTSDDKYSRAKQDNAALTARVQMLEEQLREVEMKAETRLKEEQQRFKDMVGRYERERSLDVEKYTQKVQALENENISIRDEMFRLRATADRLKQEKCSVQDQLSQTEYTLSSIREEQQKLQELGKKERDELVQERVGNARVLEELSKELQELRRFRIEAEHRINGHSVLEPPSRLHDLEEQIRTLKEENRAFREANEELQAQLVNTGIAEGRNLLHWEGTSLAAEFEAMSRDEVMDALREQRDVNSKLRAYIDGILLNILDSYPSILEVKGKHPPP